MPDRISDLLLTLGIHSTYRGFCYLHYALTLCLQDPDYLMHIFKHLYTDVAAHFDTTQGNVERCIRTVIDHCYYHGNRDFLCRIAKYPLLSRPTASEFIDILYHYLESLED